MRIIIGFLIGMFLTGCASTGGSSYWNLKPCQSITGKYDEKCLVKYNAEREKTVREYMEKNPGEQKYEADVLAKNAAIGMLEETLILSWGKPERVNETMTENVTLRQLVYKGGYVYTRNGRVSALQD